MERSALQPFHGGDCYACSAHAIGFTDRRDQGGNLESACARHADPTIKVYHACQFCSGPRPTIVIDGFFAHKKCDKEARA